MSTFLSDSGKHTHSKLAKVFQFLIYFYSTGNQSFNPIEATLTGEIFNDSCVGTSASQIINVTESKQINNN